MLHDNLWQSAPSRLTLLNQSLLLLLQYLDELLLFLYHPVLLYNPFLLFLQFLSLLLKQHLMVMEVCIIHPIAVSPFR
jgi:hypothetical protein